jgi:argininosuccinate lyase
MEKEKIWKGMIDKDPDSAAEKFTSSILTDKKLYIQDITGSAAYAVGLKSIGIITSAELGSILSGLKTVKSLIEKGEIDFTAYEDIHSLVEYELLKTAGEPAAKIHTGRSRNDQIVTDELLYMKESIADTALRTIKLLKIISEKAHIYRGIMMPAYTHMQKAQPVLVSHYLLSFFEKFSRAAGRLFENFEACDYLPLGSAACTGSGYEIDTELIKKVLKFGKTPSNSMDVVSGREYIIEYLFGLSMLMINLSRFCEDLIIFNTQEFSFIEIDDAFCTGSSIMPQKKNPDILELVRGKSAVVIGNLFSVMALFKGLPSTYNSDMQEDKKLLFNAESQTKDCMDIFGNVLANTAFKEKVVMQSVKTGFLEATDAADYLVRKGESFRNAHHIIGRIVRHCLENRLGLGELKIEQLKQYSKYFENDFYGAIEMQSCIDAKAAAGGTSVKNVELKLKESLKVIGAYEGRLKSLYERIPDFELIISEYI